MSPTTFHGTGVAIVTPFTKEGSIDFHALKNIISFLTEGGVEYLVVLGTTGESVTINKDEKQQLFSFVAEANAGKLPLVAGIGGNDTHEVIHHINSFNLQGYHAILSVSPYYSKPNQQGLYLHYKAISESTAMSVMLYNVPGRTGMNVTAETTLRIASDCKNVIATKEASGNFEQIMQIIKHKPAGFEVISGDDAIALPMIACGAVGVISVVANAYPKIFSDMIRLCLKDDFEAARSLHYKLTDIITTLFTEGNPSGVKAYMHEQGLCGNYFRLPVTGVSDKLMGVIKKYAKELK